MKYAELYVKEIYQDDFRIFGSLYAVQADACILKRQAQHHFDAEGEAFVDDLNVHKLWLVDFDHAGERVEIPVDIDGLPKALKFKLENFLKSEALKAASDTRLLWGERTINEGPDRDDEL